MIAITYLIYCIFWGTLIMGGCGYAVFVLDYSGWWFLLAVVLSGSGFKPYRWYELCTGINSRPDD